MPSNRDTILIRDHSGEVIAEKDEAIARAMEAIGIHLEGEAKEELENDPRRIDTGRLRGSIAYATQTAHGGGEAPAAAQDYNPRETPEKGAVYIGSNVEYAIYVHEGTRKMMPNAFIRNAIERNERKIKRLLEDALKGE